MPHDLASVILSTARGGPGKNALVLRTYSNILGTPIADRLLEHRDTRNLEQQNTH